MSDFARQLLERSRGTGPEPLRPRLPQVFEPVAAPDAPLDLEQVEERDAEAPRQPAPAPPPAYPVGQPPLPTLPSIAPARPSGRDASPPRPAPSSEPMPAGRSVDRDDGPQRDVRATDGDASANQSRPIEPRPSAEPPVRAGRPSRPPEKAEPEPDRQDADARDAERARAPDAPPKEPAESPTRTARRAIPQPPQLEPPPPVLAPAAEQPREAPMELPRRGRREPVVAQLAPTQLSQRADSSPGPVQVTIGRVEVRAVFAPPAAEPAPAPPAAMVSLDDYLEQRDTGG